MLDLDPLWQSICCSHSGSGELHLALTANRMRGHFYPYMGHNPAPLLLVERHIWNIIKFIWELARQLLIWKNIIQVIPHFFLLGFSEMSDYKSESCNVTIAFFPLRLFQGQFQASTLFGTSFFCFNRQRASPWQGKVVPEWLTGPERTSQLWQRLGYSD